MSGTARRIAFSLLIFGGLTNVAAAQDAHGARGTQDAAGEAAPFGMPVMDDHVWAHVIMDRLEAGFGEGDTGLVWDGEAWAGPDAYRVWLKSEGDVSDSKIEESRTEIFYSRPISTYFDLQAGARYDSGAHAGRGWAALGIEGLAPNFFHVSVTGYMSDRGHFAANAEGSFDLLLTQRLILQPRAELDLYAKNDPARGTGAGLAEIEAGLRLRYEITRKFAPYIGFSYTCALGQTGRYAVAQGGDDESALFVIGIRSWI